MLLTYFLNDFEIVPVAPIITGITFVFTFHIIIIIIIIIVRRRQVSYYSRAERFFFCNQLKYVLVMAVLTDVVLHCCLVYTMVAFVINLLLNCIGPSI